MIQIVGYRKDRLGARIIALGNLLFLADKFQVDVEYLWPDAFENHDMSLLDKKHPVFAPAFQKKYLREVKADVRPDIGNLTDIGNIRGSISNVLFAERLKRGEKFLCNEGIQPLLFSNELGPTHLEDFRRALARIEFSEPIVNALNEAVAKLKELGEIPLALHVRRGDVLDQDPWCHKNWVSKFAPDEFYQVVMRQPDTATLLFSDTPAAAARLAAEHASATTLDDLLKTPDFSELQRDLVELLLMAKCDAVVAPSLSAFSSSAALMSGMALRELPAGLPSDQRFPAYDQLLDRILKGPNSFHNDGDFAQSIGYAFGHALKEKKHEPLYALLKDSVAQGQNFAFYKPLMMALSIACNAPNHAVQIGEQARNDPNLWPEDLMICEALDCVAQHSEGGTQRATAKFLQLYLARNKSAPHLDSIANYFFANEPLFKQLFMIDQITLETFRFGRERERTFLFPIDDDLYEGALNAAFPIWIPGADWSEMFERPQILKNITNEPGFQAKRSYLPQDIKQAEIAFFRDEKELPTDKDALSLLSTLAVALSLSGRFRRATSLMFHCRKHDPENPLHLKRLANRFVTTNEPDRAEYNLNRALKLAPTHPGLVLALAKLQQDQDNHKGTDTLLSGIADQAFLPMTFYKIWEKSLRKLKSKHAAKTAIKEAAKRFPGHEIFQKQWADKL